MDLPKKILPTPDPSQPHTINSPLTIPLLCRSPRLETISKLCSPSENTALSGRLHTPPETNFAVKSLPKAYVPIIKLSLLPSPGLPFGIACDIGFENRLALENTRLLLTYATVDPARVRTMVLFVKVWSKRRRINSPYRGTLSCVYSPPFLVCRSVGVWVGGVKRRGGGLGGRGLWQLTPFFLCIAPPPPLSVPFPSLSLSLSSGMVFGNGRRSYGYTLLVLFFLIHVQQPSVLPNLQAIPPPSTPSSSPSASAARGPEHEVNGWDVWFFDDTELLRREWTSGNVQSVGELYVFPPPSSSFMLPSPFSVCYLSKSD